ncbi:MAG: zf-HC2 domain-containing protein, partial [Planctomycetes bacterium]|nr:zf-HC2 domain-containing protein [Planctomycetota bacterium]
MKCSEVRELLSGHHDGELEASADQQVRNHLPTCRACAEEAQGLSSLGRLLAPLCQCNPPAHLWEQITAAASASRFQEEPMRLSRAATAHRRAFRRRWLAAAASVAVVTSFSSYWIASRTWSASPPPRAIQTAYGLALGVYVQELTESRQPFGRFRALHQGREVSPDELVRQVGFTPLVPQELPDGFRLDKSYVLATTCCKVVELHYVKGRELVTVFQQGHGHPVSLDGFEAETTRIDGVSCRRGRIGDIVVVNFDGGGRNTTLLARADYSAIPAMVQLFNRTP